MLKIFLLEFIEYSDYHLIKGLNFMYSHTATIKVKTECRELFLKAMAINAKGSICDESTCLRFDVFQDFSDENVFYLHEAYINEAALAFHETQDHCKQCVSNFKDWLIETPTIKKTISLFAPINTWKKAKIAIVQNYRDF